MVNRSLLSFSLLAAATTAAHAQTPEPGGTPAAPPAMPAGDPFQKGTLGISVPITVIGLGTVAGVAVEPVPTVNILYFLDNKTAIDIVGGINLHHEQTITATTPPMTGSTTVFGLAVGAGYRMYKHMDKLHAYIEPQLVFAWADTSNSATLLLRLAGYFGAERMLTDWFSVSGAIGAGVNAGNKFNDIQLATTANLAANFYWK